MKRGSSSPRQGKKAARIDADISAKTTAIEHVLKSDDLPTAVPQSSRIMLAAGASYALCTVVEERHPMQVTLINNIYEVFNEIANGVKTNIAEATAEVDSKNKELETLNKQIEATSSDLNQATEGSNIAMQNLSVKEVAVRDAESRAKEEHAKRKANGKEKENLDKEKAKYTAIEDGNLKSLIEGLIAEKEVKKACAKLVKDMEKVGTDEALLASVPHVLTMRPENRKGFDTMVIDSVRADIADRQKKVDEKISVNLQAAAEIAEEVTAADQAAETARKEETEAEDSLKKANDLVAEKSNDSQLGAAAVEECQQTIASLQHKRTTAQEAAGSFQEVFDGLDFLVKRTLEQTLAASADATLAA